MKNKRTTIYIVRHGQSESNINIDNPAAVEISYGIKGSPLSPNGIKQAEMIAEKLKQVHFDAIFSSNLQRAQKTAEIIGQGRNLTILSKNTIREMYHGSFYWSKPKAIRLQLESALADLNDEERFIYKYSPDGESAKEATDRFLKFLSEIIPLYRNKTVLVVNHGAMMRMLLIYIGWARFEELPSHSITNTGYFVLETDGNKYNVKETYGITKKII